MDPNLADICRRLAGRSSLERENYYAEQQLPTDARELIEAALLNASQATTTSVRTDLYEAGTIGRYQLIRLLGRGGMGEVYLAIDPVLERDVAVKLLICEPGDADAQRRLAQEARAAGRLRHPNIVTIFDAGDHMGRPYIAMEYVRGETLGTLIRRRTPLPLSRSLELIEHACTGLAHAHKAGIVHLDIKPDNLMLDDTGIVKILDFGIARVLRDGTLITRQAAGTLRYMSPEQLEGRQLDRRTDVFSLGCALFELLSQQPAYAGSAHEIVTRIVEGPAPRLREIVPWIDARLDEVVGHAMAHHPHERYQDMEDMRAVLAQVRGDLDRSASGGVPAPASVGRAHVGSTTRTSNGDTANSGPQPVPEAALPARRVRLGVLSGVLATVTLLAAGTLWTVPGVWNAREGGVGVGTSPGLVESSTDTAAADPRVPAPYRPGIDPSGADDVWRILARGDRQGVLRSLQTSGNNADTVQRARLAGEVVEAVRAVVLEARQSVRSTPNSRAQPAYQRAEDQLVRAERIAADRPIEALSVFWEAADLYRQAGAVLPGPPVPDAHIPSTKQADSRPAPAPQSPAPTVQPNTVPSSVTNPEATTTPGAASLTPRASDGRTDLSGKIATTVAPSDADAVLAVLLRYRDAFVARDLNGVRRVFPGLAPDQIEQLRRTFSGLSAYELEIQDPRVDVQGDTAIVRAVVARRMVPQVGQPVVSKVQNEFALHRDAGVWIVVGVRAIN